MFVKPKESDDDGKLQLMTITVKKAFSYKAFHYKKNFKVSVRKIKIDTKFLEEKRFQI